MESEWRVDDQSDRFGVHSKVFLSVPVVTKAENRRAFRMNYIVSKNTNPSWIPSQLVDALDLREQLHTEQNDRHIDGCNYKDKPYVILRVSFSSTAYEKFYVYNFTGEMRMGANLANQIGLGHGIRPTDGYDLPHGY